jgi:hypothetical protein
MKTQNLKIILLAVIALNLTFLSVNELEIFVTKTYANENEFLPEFNYALIPVNEDGSINVKLNKEDINKIKPNLIQEVDIMGVSGYNLATYTKYTRDGEKYNSIGVTVLD